MNSIASERLTHYGDLTDKNSFHTYGSVYDEIMHDKVDDKIRLLEIGVGNYGSMKAWLDVFIDGKIVGVDKNLHKNTMVARECFANERCTLIEDDVTNLKFKVDGKFDYIIEDGSNTIEDIEISFKKLFPQLKKGGYYIIEDVKDNRQWMPIIQKALDGKGSFYNKMLDTNRVFDDIIYVIKKR